MPDAFVPAHEIRAHFSNAMSQMYREEVPSYGHLLDIVRTVNTSAIVRDVALARQLSRNDEIARIDREYHGAIRLGKPAELDIMRRLFAVMGMFPVGYYDLSVAGIPVHSTAFRPVDSIGINRNPFRIFTSLLRLELIEDEALREEVERVLSRREIVLPHTRSLIERYEAQGGLRADDAQLFVETALETFRWHPQAFVSAELYERLHQAHPLIADIASFKGPHINHLTPRALDIDAAQAMMLAEGIGAKDVIEGPPTRKVPILLRQTSFRALRELIRFAGEGGAPGQEGAHTARFGEIEQRGLALTPKGQALYDKLLQKARVETDGPKTYNERLIEAFGAFPDDPTELRRAGLGYFQYNVVDAPRAAGVATEDVETLIAKGAVIANPITYEDFLPVSAAGIFQSNLGTGTQAASLAQSSRSAFEAALGAPVHDLFAWYAAIERESLVDVRQTLAAANEAGT